MILLPLYIFFKTTFQLARALYTLSPLSIDILASLVKKINKTYNSRDSLVVTHQTTNWPVCGLNAVSTWVATSQVS